MDESAYVEHREFCGRKEGMETGRDSCRMSRHLHRNPNGLRKPPSRCLVWEGTVSGNDSHWKCVCLECLRRSRGLFGWSGVRGVLRMGTGTGRSWGLDRLGFVALSEMMGTSCGILNRGLTRSDLQFKGVPLAAVKGTRGGRQGRSKEMERSCCKSPRGRQWWIEAAGIFPNPQLQAGA